MANETTRMFRAVVVAGVSLTACSGAPVAVPTPGESQRPATSVDPVNDGKSTAMPTTAPALPVNDGKSTGETAVAPVATTVAVDATPAGAGDPLAAKAEDAKAEDAKAADAKTEPRKAKKSAAERKREAEERKRREWEEKFPHIL